jgi:hypothetical protein
MMYYYVEICRLCGKYYRNYHNEVRGDPTVCRECEEQSEEQSQPNEEGE